MKEQKNLPTFLVIASESDDLFSCRASPHHSHLHVGAVFLPHSVQKCRRNRIINGWIIDDLAQFSPCNFRRLKFYPWSFFSFLSFFFMTTPRSAAAQWMAIKCIPEVRRSSQAKLEQLVWSSRPRRHVGLPSANFQKARNLASFFNITRELLRLKIMQQDIIRTLLWNKIHV